MTTDKRWEIDTDELADDRVPDRGAGPHRPVRSRRVLVLLVTMGLVVAATVLALAGLRPLVSGFAESNDFPGPGTGSVTITVNEGDSGRAMGATLEKAHVVKSARAFVDAFSADPRSAVIQPGEYQMREEMTAADALAVLVDPANRQVSRVTLREGLMASEVYAELSRVTGHPVSDYEAAAKDTAALGLPAAARGRLEGYLFPATYEFSAKNPAAEQLRQMVGKTMAELTGLGVSAEQAQRVLTVASMVEAEGRRAEDRPKIARVIENRLVSGVRLQMDSTVTYPRRNATITTSDAQRATVTPWNTYAIDGLPAGPINNPGASAIEAAATPADGPWLFFVTVNPASGDTRFATTNDEHIRNVAQFQAWCQANAGQC